MKLKFFGLVVAFGCLLITVQKATGQMKYPVTRKVDQTDNYFGTSVSDPYRWLEYDTSADTKQWAETEQAFTEKYLSQIPYRAAVQKQLEKLRNYSRFYSGFKAGE